MLIILLAFVAVALAQLAANTPCGNSVQCSLSCRLGAYHIVTEGPTFDGGFASFFACQPNAVIGVPQYYDIVCYVQVPSDISSGNRKACEAAAGELGSKNVCVVLPQNRQAFSSACTAQQTGGYQLRAVQTGPTNYVAACASAGCTTPSKLQISMLTSK